MLNYSSAPVPPLRDYSKNGYEPSCNAAWQQYTSASSAWWSLVGTRSTKHFGIATSQTTRVLGRAANPTVLADGFTRMSGKRSDPAAWIPTSTQSVDRLWEPPYSVSTTYYNKCLADATAANIPEFPNPTPACGIRPQQCADADSSQSEQHESTSICGQELYRRSTCHIYASKVSIFYWPSATASANQGQNVSPSANTPVSAVIGTDTVYSPSVYLSLEHIGMARTWFVDKSTTSVNSQLATATNTLLALPPESLYSVVYTVPGCQGLCPDSLSSIFNTPSHPHTHLSHTKQPYNPATVDPNVPVPASAYFWGKVDAGYNIGRTPLQSLYYEPIEQIIWDNYLPQIAAPDQLRFIDPDWIDCKC